MTVSDLALSEVSTGMLVHPADGATGAAIAGPASTPTMRFVSRDAATVNPAFLRFQNPVFRPPILAQGVSRTSLNLPTMVSPSVTPTDGTLFEDPQNGSHKFFLPIYQLAVTASGATLGKWVSFAPIGTGFLLTVHLADATPAAQASGASRLSPDTRYLVTAVVQGRIVTWDLTVAATGSDGGLTLTLSVADFAGRDLLYTAMTDPAARAQLIVRRSLALALPIAGSANFAPQTIAIDSPIAFAFSKDLDAQVFAQLQGAGATPPAPWKAVNVNWNGRVHTYFQSSSQLDQVYFLPDAFKVGRQSQSPHLPNLAVTTQGDTAANLAMTLSYFALPEWDTGRLVDAGPRLQSLLGLPQSPSLALFEASDAILMLSLPGADPAAGVTLQQQANVIIDLAAGVQGSVTCGLAAFRQIYDALFDQHSTVLAGEVRVTVESNVIALPFVARIGDMVGEIFDTTVAIDSKANTMAVTLTNAIECPIHLEGLTGVITRPDKPIDSNITAMSPSPPVDLAPAAATPAGSLSVTLAPNALQGLGGLLGGKGGVGGLLGGLLGGGGGPDLGKPDLGKIGSGAAGLVLDSTCTPLFDFSQVTVTPDPKATWRAIMAHGTPGPVSRVVALKLVAASVAKPAAGTPTPPDAAMAIQVVFQSGQTVEFDASQTADAAGFLNQAVTLTVPVEAFVLGDGPTDTYTYQVDIVTLAGVRQGASVTDNRDTLFIVPG